MSKTQPEIAKAILERRNRMTHVILPGDMNAAIGPDGLREALQQRWLVPDMDEGYLCVTNDLGKLAEMRKLADMKPEQYKQEVIPVAESHDMALLHTRRAHPINEISAPMTGQPSPGLTSVSQPTSQPVVPPPATTSAPAKDPLLMTLVRAEEMAQQKFGRGFKDLDQAQQAQIQQAASVNLSQGSPATP